jgi:hypothetical protein
MQREAELNSPLYFRTGSQIHYQIFSARWIWYFRLDFFVKFYYDKTTERKNE